MQNDQIIFTGEANGNLKADGSTTYAYDFANRLISTTLGGGTTQFSYNGDGVRLQLIEAGTLTTYTQDLVAPLPVVLQAKTGTAVTQYVYSLGTRPLAEYEAAAWEYLLADALGSVRQIADTSGNVTLLKSYEPYGSVLNSQGTATSVFAYAGEQVDGTGLVYLRARYMQPGLGVFLSRDPWMGDYQRPLSLNGWSYVEGNPINAIDPSGQVMWGRTTGGDEEQLIEWIYELRLGFARTHLEYELPKKGPGRGGRGERADLILMSDPSFVASGFGYVYEIEPWRTKARAQREVGEHVDALNQAAQADELVRTVLQDKFVKGQEYDWNDVLFKEGEVHRVPQLELPAGVPYPTLQGFIQLPWPGLVLKAEPTQAGIILWWYDIHDAIKQEGERAVEEFLEQLPDSYRDKVRHPISGVLPQPVQVPARVPQQDPIRDFLEACLVFGAGATSTYYALRLSIAIRYGSCGGRGCR